MIEAGAKQAYLENLMMTQNYTSFESRMIESLIVINVAQHLMHWGVSKGLKVNLEYPLRQFYNGAFPAFINTSKDIFNQSMDWRKDHNPKGNKSGRMDIVITGDTKSNQVFHDPSEASLVGVEVKAINKSDKSIKKDISRLFDAMIEVDTVGNNAIGACYSLFFRSLHNDKKGIIESEIIEKKEKEREKWANQLKQLEIKNSEIQFELHEIPIEQQSIEEAASTRPPEHFDYEDLIENSGLVVCYLIKIKRKE